MIKTRSSRYIPSSALFVLVITAITLLPIQGNGAAPEIHPEKFAAPAPSQVPEFKGGPIVLPAATTADGAGTEAPAAGDTLAPPNGVYTLADLVSAALQTNPVTRSAWAQAMASAANWGIARSSYYPSVNATGQGVAGDIPQLQGGNSYVDLEATLNYLLLDFGNRRAASEAAKHGLIAANWNHNQAIQDVLRNVPQAYYTFLAYRSQVRADEQSLTEATTTVKATEERLRSGVSTISDVLQARSNADQVRLQLASDRGQMAIAKGTLATAIGWPANRPFEVAPEPERLPVKDFGRNVDGLVELARANRPALGAALHAMKQKEAQLKQARTLPFPQLSATGTLQFLATRDENGRFNFGGVSLSLPIFDGFKMQNSVRAARAQLEASRADLRTQEETTIADVWNAYHNYQTSSEQLTASRSLLASASESYSASSARYREGAADIIELLNAQTVLASARAQNIAARMTLSTSYAELVHAVGTELPDSSDTAGGATHAAH